VRGSTVDFSAPCRSRVASMPSPKITATARMLDGVIRASPMDSPSQKRA
jgi:hypothetical protein